MGKNRLGKWKHWCPDRCGKGCYYDQIKKKYVCEDCNGEFTKEQMQEAGCLP